LNKLNIINDLAKEKNLTINDSEKIVSTIVEEISKSLILGERVEFRGFGIFFTKSRKKRVARNPKTGELINIKAKRLPQFRIAKYFYKKINE
jgi:integration host factor subunit beta